MISSKHSLTFIVLIFVLVHPVLTGFAQDTDTIPPPEGFDVLFNGKDLDGWHGQRNVNPYKLAELSEAERAKQFAEDQEDMQKHWRVEDGAIFNDGNGVFLSTDKDYGDFELLIDYKTVAKADSGIYLKACPPGPNLGLHRRGWEMEYWCG